MPSSGQMSSPRSRRRLKMPVLSPRSLSLRRRPRAFGRLLLAALRQVVGAGGVLVGPVAVAGAAARSVTVVTVAAGCPRTPDPSRRAGVAPACIAAASRIRAVTGTLPACHPALDALRGEVLTRRPALVFVATIAIRRVVVVAVFIITPGVAIATAWPRGPTAQERHSTPPGRARPGVGANEARAAIYASLPPLSRAPCNRHWFVQIVTDPMPILSGESRNFAN